MSPAYIGAIYVGILVAVFALLFLVT